jgi:hypothetical protein
VKLEIKYYYEKQAVSFKISLEWTIFTALVRQPAYFKTYLLNSCVFFGTKNASNKRLGGEDVKIREEIHKINNSNNLGIITKIKIQLTCTILLEKKISKL